MARPDVRDTRIPEILDAAARVFSKDGVDGSSMNQIARESGISKATIYHYFKSKNEIVQKLVSRLFEEDVPEIEAIVNSKRPVVLRILDYSDGLCELLERNSQLFPILAEFKAIGARSESVRQVLRGFFERYILVFEKVLEQGIQRQELVPDLSPRPCATALVALIEGCILLSQDTGMALRPLLTDSVAIFLQGLEV